MLFVGPIELHFKLVFESGHLLTSSFQHGLKFKLEQPISADHCLAIFHTNVDMLMISIFWEYSPNGV